MDIAVATRPVRPTDQTLFCRLWGRLSRESVYRRFHAPVRTLPEESVRRLVTVDHDLREAVVAVVGGEVIGDHDAGRVVLRLRRDREPVDRTGGHPGPVRLHVDAKAGAAHGGRERRVPLERGLAAGDDHAVGAPDVELAEPQGDLAGGVADRALGREVGIAARAVEVAGREAQEHAGPPGVSPLALQRGPEHLFDEVAAVGHGRWELYPFVSALPRSQRQATWMDGREGAVNLRAGDPRRLVSRTDEAGRSGMTSR